MDTGVYDIVITAYNFRMDNLKEMEDAIRYADSANDVRLEIKMLDRDQGAGGDEFSLSYDEKDDTGRFMGRS